MNRPPWWSIHDESKLRQALAAAPGSSDHLRLRLCRFCMCFMSRLGLAGGCSAQPEDWRTFHHMADTCPEWAGWPLEQTDEPSA